MKNVDRCVVCVSMEYAIQIKTHTNTGEGGCVDELVAPAPAREPRCIGYGAVRPNASIPGALGTPPPQRRVRSLCEVAAKLIQRHGWWFCHCSDKLAKSLSSQIPRADARSPV